MFTGLVAAVSRVVSKGAALQVERPATFSDIAVGESIAVSGVCLTALPGPGPLRFDVSPETLRRSTLGSYERGDLVNLERALAVGERFGGHLVSGHVDATTPVVRVSRDGDFWTFTFAVPASLARYVVEKGSIALDGISLTIAALREGELDVAVIPHTFQNTTLGGRKAGDLVNVEVDVLGKYVERILAVSSTEALDARLTRLLS